jgi:hypothetical protein
MIEISDSRDRFYPYSLRPIACLADQGSSIKVQVFQDRKEAAEWLGAPRELLAAKPVGGEPP